MAAPPINDSGLIDGFGAQLGGWACSDSGVFVWGGAFCDDGIGMFSECSGGAMYSPGLDEWRTVSDAPLAARVYPRMLWIGDSFLVWGGGTLETMGTSSGEPVAYSDGARYFPERDEWVSMNSEGAPQGRMNFGATWNGSVLIVWGGEDAGGRVVEDAGEYDPAQDSWSPVTQEGAPEPRAYPRLAASDDRLFVLPSWNDGAILGGGAYRFSEQEWTSIADIENGTCGVVASIWTGEKLIVAAQGEGGCGLFTYNNEENIWISISGGPSISRTTSLHWNGELLFVHGGTSSGPDAVYDPRVGTWSGVTDEGAPAGRVLAASCWVSGEFVIWGGQDGHLYNFVDGAVYDPDAEPPVGGE